MVAVQSRTAPGARVPGSRATARSSATSAASFPAAYWLSAVRLVSAVPDDLSWTVRPDTAARVGLLTVPCTVTGRPGVATCGFTEVMPTVTRWEPAAGRAPAGPVTAAVAALAGPAPASAGPPAISAANAHASTPRRASRGHAGLAGLWSRCVGH